MKRFKVLNLSQNGGDSDPPQAGIGSDSPSPIGSAGVLELDKRGVLSFVQLDGQSANKAQTPYIH